MFSSSWYFIPSASCYKSLPTRIYVHCTGNVYRNSAGKNMYRVSINMSLPGTELSIWKSWSKEKWLKGLTVFNYRSVQLVLISWTLLFFTFHFNVALENIFLALKVSLLINASNKYRELTMIPAARNVLEKQKVYLKPSKCFHLTRLFPPGSHWNQGTFVWPISLQR